MCFAQSNSNINNDKLNNVLKTVTKMTYLLYQNRNTLVSVFVCCCVVFSLSSALSCVIFDSSKEDRRRETVEEEEMLLDVMREKTGQCCLDSLSATHSTNTYARPNSKKKWANL